MIWLRAGLSDVRKELASTGSGDIFFLDADEHQQGLKPLIELSKTARIVFTEDMPVEPHIHWLQKLKTEAAKHTSIVAVDTHCIVPQKCTEATKSCERAYAFRSATEGIRTKLLRNGQGAALLTALDESLQAGSESTLQANSDAEAKQSSFERSQIDLSVFGFKDVSVELSSEEGLRDLLGRLKEVDRSVSAVSHIRGGSRWGYARWSW